MHYRISTDGLILFYVSLRLLLTFIGNGRLRCGSHSVISLQQKMFHVYSSEHWIHWTFEGKYKCNTSMSLFITSILFKTANMQTADSWHRNIYLFQFKKNNLLLSTFL